MNIKSKKKNRKVLIKLLISRKELIFDLNTIKDIVAFLSNILEKINTSNSNPNIIRTTSRNFLIVYFYSYL